MLTTATTERTSTVEERVDQIASDDLLGHARDHTAFRVAVALWDAGQRPLVTTGRMERDVLVLLPVRSQRLVVFLMARIKEAENPLMTVRTPNEKH